LRWLVYGFYFVGEGEALILLAGMLLQGYFLGAVMIIGGFLLLRFGRRILVLLQMVHNLSWKTSTTIDVDELTKIFCPQRQIAL
jgi:hypothetical protein